MAPRDAGRYRHAKARAMLGHSAVLSLGTQVATVGIGMRVPGCVIAADGMSYALPVFRLRAPSSAEIEEILRECGGRSPSAPGLAELDLDRPPSGFVRDDYGADLGTGRETFAAAARAAKRWAVYPPGWTSVHAGGEPIARGLTFLSVIRHYGFCSVLPGRVREVIDDADRFAFSFVTLEGHAEVGVERFAVSRDGATDVVRYQVTSASRPTGIVRLGAGIARRLQLRFHADTIEGMRRAVADELRVAP